MKKKFLLPVMAMVVAIGMSFATEKSTANPNEDYALTPDGAVPIAEISNCGNQMNESCSAILVVGGEAFPVFDDAALTIPKMGGAEVARH